MQRTKRLCAFGLAIWAAMLACNLPNSGSRGANWGSGPLIKIDSPASGTQVNLGDEVQVQSTSIDPSGVARVDLQLNGQIVRSDAPPETGATEFIVVQSFTASEVGSIKISVIAVNLIDKTSVSNPITIEVVATGEQAPATETSTPSAPTETDTPPTTQPTATTNATLPATPTNFVPPSATSPSVVISTATPTSAGPLVVDGVSFVGATRDAANPDDGLVTLSVEFYGGTGPYTVFDRGQPLTTSQPHGTFMRNGSEHFYIHYGPIRWRCGTTLVGEGVLSSSDGQSAGFSFYFENIQCS